MQVDYGELGEVYPDICFNLRQEEKASGMEEWCFQHAFVGLLM